MATFNVYTPEDITKKFIKKSEKTKKNIFYKTLSIFIAKDDDNESSENILYMNRNGDLIEAVKLHHKDFKYDKSKIDKLTIAYDCIPNITVEGYNNPATDHWTKKPLYDSEGKQDGEFIEHPDLIRILWFCKTEFQNLRKNAIEIIVITANKFIDKRLAENITFAIVAHKHKNPHANSLMEYVVFCQGRNTYRCMSNLLNIDKQKYQYARNLCISSTWNYPSESEVNYKVLMQKKKNIEMLLAITLTSNVINILMGTPLNDRIVYMENKANFFLDNSPDNRKYATITAENRIVRPDPLEPDIPNRNRNYNRNYNRNQSQNQSYTPRNNRNVQQQEISYRKRKVENDQPSQESYYRTFPNVQTIENDQPRQDNYNRTSPNLQTIEDNQPRQDNYNRKSPKQDKRYPPSKDDESITIKSEIINVIIDREQITIDDKLTNTPSKDECNAVMKTLNKDLVKANICIPSSEQSLASQQMEDKIAKLQYELVLKKQQEAQENIRKNEEMKLKEEEAKKKEILEIEEKIKIDKETKRKNQEIIEHFPFTTTNKLVDIEETLKDIKRNFDSMDSKIDVKFGEILENIPNKKVKLDNRRSIVDDELLKSRESRIKQLERENAKLTTIDNSEKTTLLKTIADNEQIFKTKIEELQNKIKDMTTDAMLVIEHDPIDDIQINQLKEEKNLQLEINMEKDEEIESLKKKLEYKNTNEIMLLENIFNTDAFVIEIEASMNKKSPETTEAVIDKIHRFIADKFEQYDIDTKQVQENTKTIVYEIITNFRFDDSREPTPSTSGSTPWRDAVTKNIQLCDNNQDQPPKPSLRNQTPNKSTTNSTKGKGNGKGSKNGNS